MGLFAVVSLVLVLATAVVWPAYYGSHASTYQTGNSDFPWWDSAAFWTAAFTAVLTVSTILLWLETRRLATLAERQAEDTQESLSIAKQSVAASVAGQRAWISIEKFVLQTTTAIAKEHARYDVYAVVKNMGKSPATNVWMDFDSYYPRSKTPDGRHYKEALTEFREVLLKAPPVGKTLFPESELTQGFKWFDGDEKVGKIWHYAKANADMIDVFLFVGVRYMIAGDPKPHHTLNVHAMQVQVGETESLFDQPFNPPLANFMPGEAD